MRMRRFRVIEAASGYALEIPHGIVCGVADQTAEQRHTRDLRLGLRRAHQRRAQRVEQLRLGPRPGRVQSADVQTGCLQPHLETVAEADERIAREPLPTLDAFQQKTRAKRRELQIRRHRRIEIGGNVKGWLHKLNNKKPITVFRRRWVLDIDDL